MKEKTKEEAFGRKLDFELIGPDKVIFVDKVGSNRLQKNVDNVGGEKLLVCPDSHA